jgi:glycosyltransferase involved in cell wall biosynthesis/acetyltransferase-like isoleucine patch superfamily enzyme
MKKNEITIYYGMQFEEFNKTYYCNGAFGRYLDELANNFEKIYLVVPVSKIDKEKNEYSIKSPNIIVQGVYNYNGYISAIKNAKKIKKEIANYSLLWEGIIYIRWPVPFFKYVSKIAERKLLPVTYHLVGDSYSVIKDGSKYNKLKRIIMLVFARIIDFRTKKEIKKYPTLINGNGLNRLFSMKNTNVKCIRTSTLLDTEIVSNPVLTTNEIIRLLYVGYIRHEKGLKFLIDAVYQISKNHKIELTIIGNGDELKDLQNYCENNSIDSVVFKGYIPIGSNLFMEYKDKDIFVLPSISEGTPRVLLESMANAVPIIASNVGGIPFTIENGYNGILIESGNSVVLANTILSVYNNYQLRQKLVKNGIEFAKKNTLKTHVAEVVGFLQDKNFKNIINDDVKHTFISKVFRNLFISLPVHYIFLITSLIPNSTIATKTRGFLLKPFFKKCGKNFQIASGVTINMIRNISIGDNVYIAHNCWLNATEEIYLEEGTIIGPFSVLATTKHKFINGYVSNADTEAKKIRVGKGTWLASHVVVTSGVEIGNGVLVGAGAVVTKDLPSHSFCGGIPATVIEKKSVLYESEK